MIIIRNIFFICSLVILFCFSGFSQNLDYYDFKNLMDYSYTPESIDSEKKYYSGNGSLFGFSLPDKDSKNYFGSFLGPFSIVEKKWVSKSFLNFGLSDGSLIPFNEADSIEIFQLPGMLCQNFIFDDFSVKQKLIMLSGRSALVQTSVINQSDSIKHFALRVDGTPFADVGVGGEFADGWKFEFIDNSDLFFLIRFRVGREMAFGFSHDYYEFSDKELFPLEPGDTMNLNVSISQYFVRDSQLDTDLTSSAVLQPELYFKRNIDLWNFYLSRIPPNDNSDYVKLVIKSLQTIILNLRSPSHHMSNYYFTSDSRSDYDYFLTDESWLYSAALLNFDPSLSKHHYLSMMRNQSGDGSLPALIKPIEFREINPDIKNKYPLAAWNAWNIFSVNPDGQFILQALPILEKYFDFWYSNMDTNKNKWIENNKGQECPIINAMLYTEKYALEKISEILNEEEKKHYYSNLRNNVKNEFNSKFFDENLKHYVSINIHNGDIEISEHGGAFALWAGLATAEIANIVAKEYHNFLYDSVEANDFWNNEIDPFYMYFLISGLKNYGFNELSEAFTKRLVSLILKEGIQSPLKNLYNTNDTDIIYNSPKTAAVLILLLGHN